MNPNVARLISQYKDHHEEEALITLWQDFQPLVLSTMRKFYTPLASREDVQQDAFLRFLECAKNYDISQGVPFESYYKINLHYQFLNRIQKKTELLVVDHDWSNGGSMSDLIESTLGNAQERVEENETKKALKEALGLLTEKQRYVITLYYLQRMTLVQIANQMGCSYKVACKHKDAGLKKIRKQWGLSP